MLYLETFYRISMSDIVTSYIQCIIGVTSFKREKIWPWKVEGVGLIETFRVGSVADKSNKFMLVTVYDINQKKYQRCKLKPNMWMQTSLLSKIGFYK